MAKDDDETFSRQVAIRLTKEDVQRLDRLTARVRIASRNAVARAALRIGLDVLEEKPARIMGEGPPPRRGRKARS
jgi:hypothetical protein